MAKTFQRRRSSIKKEFTEKELQDLRTAFELLDRNQDGRVTAGELQYMLDKLGIKVNDEVLQDLIKAASHQGKDLIDENDFLHWVKIIQDLRPDVKNEDDSKDLLAAFRVFDLDNNGYITRDELEAAMETIGEPVTEQQITEFIQMADTDKDGKINYEEFTRLLTKI